METKDSLESLKDSLIYIMSLGSRELYHSNIWAWLINHDYHFIKVFFKDFDESKYNIPKEIDAKREKDHFDLCFSLTNIEGEEEFFIIENKIKSFITTKQLDKYTEVIKNKKVKNKETKKYEHYESKNVHAIYTGINDNLNGYESKIDDSFTVNWSFRSYEEIGTAIKGVESILTGNISENIMEYAETILIMSQTLSKLLLDDKIEEIGDYKFTYDVLKEYKDSLEELRLYDIYKKMKVAHFSNYVEQSEKFEELKKLTPEGYALDFWTSFSNTHPIFDIHFKREVETTKKDKKVILLSNHYLKLEFKLRMICTVMLV